MDSLLLIPQADYYVDVIGVIKNYPGQKSSLTNTFRTNTDELSWTFLDCKVTDYSL